MTQIHSLAEPAAETAEYAAANKRFWEMHDALYENQQRLSTPTFFELAAALDLDIGGLQRALETREFRPRVRHDFMSGVRSGVNGTPTFFINGVRHEGGFEYKDLADALDAALSRPKRKVS